MENLLKIIGNTIGGSYEVYIMRILIVWIARFLGHNGGMEKVSIRFANEMIERGHSVALAYCTEHDGKAHTLIDSRVRVVNIAHCLPDGKWESHKTTSFKIKREAWRLIGKSFMLDYIRKCEVAYLKPGVQRLLEDFQPDVVVTLDAKTTSAIKWADSTNRYPVITMSHFNAENILSDASAFDKKSLRNSDVVQVLMPHDMEVFSRALPGINLIHIPNIVPQYHISSMEKRDSCNKIIDIARLSRRQKRQHLLIESFAKIARKYPQWKVELWGEEQDSNQYTMYLTSLIIKYHLESQVFLRGNAENVIDIYKKADIFAFPSAFEGFPLAMTESMSAGLAVIAFQSCPAVNELIQSGRNGLLVKDGVKALSEGLEYLMTNREKRLAFGKQAQQDMKKYAAKEIWDQWEKLMIEVVSSHK